MANGLTGALVANESALSDDRGFRGDVEGLRAVAIVTVIGYHFKLAPFRGGYVGVDLFFVVSGFVITRLLLSERHQHWSSQLLNFYARRIRRILPAATVTIVLTVIATAVVLGSASANAAAHDGLSAGFFFANFHFAALGNGYLTSSGSSSPLVHFWSLSIEEQFYVLWPTLLVLTLALAPRRYFRLVVLVVLIVIMGLATWYSIHLTSLNITSAYYSSFIRAGELALGAAVAVGAPWWRRQPGWLARTLGWCALAVLIVSACWFNDSTLFPGWRVAVPTVATAAILVAGYVPSTWSVGSLLAQRSLMKVGALSFSLYLWHWPVYDLVQLRLGHVPSWPWRVALVVPTAALALLSYSLVENPIRRKKFFSTHRTWTYALGVGLLCAGLGVNSLTIASTSGATSFAVVTPVTSLSALQSQLAVAANLRTVPTLVVPLSALSKDVPFAGFDRGCLVAFNATSATGSRPANCFFGDLTSPRTMVLFGDSNADMWIAAFDALGQRNHFRVELLARASCQLPDLHLWNPAQHVAGKTCTAFRAWALGQIRQLHPFVVIATDYEYALRWNYRDQLISAHVAAIGLARTLEKIADTGAHTILLGPPPAVMSEPGLCLSTHTNVANCAAPRLCLQKVNQARPICQFDPATGRSWDVVNQLASLAVAGNASYVSVDSLFCSRLACPAIVHHFIVNFDLRHVSMHYSIYVSEVLGQLLSSTGVSLSN